MEVRDMKLPLHMPAPKPAVFWLLACSGRSAIAKQV